VKTQILKVRGRIMIKTFSLLLCALLMSIVASPVFAAYNGFYFGALAGAANTHYSAADIEGITSAEIDKTGFGAGVYAGYQWTRNWAVELGYTGYPRTSFQNINQAGLEGKISENATDLVGKIMLPFDCRLGAYAKAGVAYVDIDRSGYLRRGVSKNGYSPTYGGGFSYDINPNTPIVITWMRVQETNHIPNADLLSLGIEYHFG
jgi:opacity protein-like surface antigen